MLLIPTWDNSDEWLSTLRHTAKEGQVFVVGVTAYLRGNDVPRDLPGADEMYGDEEDHLSRGNTTIVAPGPAILPTADTCVWSEASNLVTGDSNWVTDVFCENRLGAERCGWPGLSGG